MITRRTLMIAASALVTGGAAAAISRWQLRRTAPTIVWTSKALAAAPPGQLFKNPQCSCCETYATYLRRHGLTVTVVATNDLAEIDRKAGMSEDLEGCHTMFIGDYFVSGHVVVEAIEKLLSERPNIKGITLPGMPGGSPGMSGPKEGPLTIYAIGKDGKSSVYMTV
jgi:hypothetical protein